MSKTVSFFTQGCRLNQAETAILERSFESLSFQVVPFDQPAQVVVINTCTVTENGDADTRRLVNKINRVNTDSKIALVGCQSQILKEKLLAYPNVKWVIGNAQKFDLARIVSETWDQDETVLRAEKMTRESFTVPLPGIDRHHTRANIKLQDGCDFYCAFCVIPFARGPARSREFEDIIKETRALVEAGHKEIVLTGINLGTYDQQDKVLFDVVEVMEGVPELDRIRISSIEPTTLSDAVIDRMAQADTKLCPYLHIPLQSGSDTILDKMSRNYTTAFYRDLIEKIHARIPNVGLGTDVIVGFPGETYALFQETYDFLESLPLSYFHVFSYSERQFARSKKMEGKVEEAVIQQRSLALRTLSTAKKKAFYTSQIGSTVAVLVEQKKRGLWTGLTGSYIRVVFESDASLENKIVQVRLESCSDSEPMVMKGVLV